jgi:hypothetical protein
MSRTRIYYAGAQPYKVYKENSYGFWKFALDLFMVCVTFGLWIIWIIIREIKNG